MNRLELKIFVSAYIILIVTMFVLPFYSAEGYSILKHTTSQLGAQKTSNSWIMNAVFVLMGSTTILAGWSHYDGYRLHQVLLSIFGLSLILVAFFGHAPITDGVSYSEKVDNIHSLLATITGFSFTFLAIATAFIKKGGTEMVLPLVIGILATVLSLLMFKFESLMGVWQRIIFLSSFGWMIFEFRN